jgi:nucleotide-binding universal stress UspA family protein
VRILLAIDDSKFSEAAIETLLEQARPHGTEVRVLHVLESPPLLVARELGGFEHELEGFEPALESALEFQKQHAEAVVGKAAELLRARGLKVTTAVEMGDPSQKSSTSPKSGMPT